MPLEAQKCTVESEVTGQLFGRKDIEFWIACLVYPSKEQSGWQSSGTAMLRQHVKNWSFGFWNSRVMKVVLNQKNGVTSCCYKCSDDDGGQLEAYSCQLNKMTF